MLKVKFLNSQLREGKKMKKIILSVAGVLAFSSVALAASVGTFPIAVSIPAATSVTFNVAKVTGSGPTLKFEKNPSENLDFTVNYDTTNNIYLANQYFAIDLAPDGSATYSSITFSYTGETNPVGQTNGLGVKATMSPVKVVGSTETALSGFGVRLGGTLPTITNDQVSGGFLRVYVGLATGETIGGTGADKNDPKIPGSAPFTAADKVGNYGGTFKITATLV